MAPYHPRMPRQRGAATDRRASLFLVARHHITRRAIFLKAMRNNKRCLTVRVAAIDRLQDVTRSAARVTLPRYNKAAGTRYRYSEAFVSSPDGT